jgi:hypothetical protein
MLADDPAAFPLDDSRPNVLVDTYTQGLFETAEPSRASGNSDPTHKRRTTA